ncbi:MAG: hypothetical protein QXN10_01585 [Desulfurococcaceae archaeon]
MMRVISDTIASIIMVSALISLMLIAISVVIPSVIYAFKNMEYNYLRSTFIQIAQFIPLALRAGSMSTSITPTAGYGYGVIGALEVYLNNTLVYMTPCMAFQAGIANLPLGGRMLVYGSDNLLVNDTRLLARVVSYYDKERNMGIIELDTCRVYYIIEPTEVGTTIAYLVRLNIINLTTIVRKSTGDRTSIAISMFGAPSIVEYTGLNLTIIYREKSGVITRRTYMRDVYPEYTGGDIRVQIITYNMRIEI